MRSYLLFLIPSLFVIFGMTSAFAQEAPIIPGEYIITLNQSSSDLIFAELTDIQIKSLQQSTQTNRVFLVTTDPNNLIMLEQDDRILYIEPNRMYETQGFSNGMPFGMDRIDADLRPNYNNGIDDDTTITIGIMDTGINLNLANRINIVDRIDVGHGLTDFNGHGSHVSGIAAGCDDNIDNVIGSAACAGVIMIKVCPAGCPTSSMIAAIDAFIANADQIASVNVSIGGVRSDRDNNCGFTIIDQLQQAYCRGADAGIVFVVSPGNGDRDAGAPNEVTVPCVSQFP